jgi:hypothetical protein
VDRRRKREIGGTLWGDEERAFTAPRLPDQRPHVIQRGVQSLESKKAFATMEDELKDEMVNVRRVDHQLCLLNNMRFVFLNDPATTSEAKDKSRVLLSFRDYILSKQSEWSSNSITPCSKWAIKRKAELSPPKPASTIKMANKSPPPHPAATEPSPRADDAAGKVQRRAVTERRRQPRSQADGTKAGTARRRRVATSKVKSRRGRTGIRATGIPAKIRFRRISAPHSAGTHTDRSAALRA